MIETVAIISTGDELTTGKVVDTNSAAIADRLFSAGLDVAAVLKVGDDKNRLLWALRHARDLSDLIIGTGGLGPTADDLTTETVAEFLGRKLEQDEEIATSLRQRFAAREITWTPNNLKQARFPEGSVVIPNPVGTAPGFRVSIGRDKTLIWLSGVPQEMTTMMTGTVLPWIAGERPEEAKFLACTFKIYGITESKLDDLLKPVSLSQDVKLSFRAHYPDLSLRLTVRDGGEQERTFEQSKTRIRELLGSHLYAEAEVTLEEIVGQLLMAKRRTLALAESCTGGYISHRITRVAGSSAYFYGGAVTYSNEAKLQYLGVSKSTLDRHGAVSRETALEMSLGIRKRSQASLGLSVTGIAGPTGGTADKPVGTVWISIAQEKRHEARLFHFHGDRERIIIGTAQAALNWLRLTLIE